jgi:muramoyltetrapeptide carboxypeptidase
MGMVKETFTVRVIAPACAITEATADKVKALATDLFGPDRLDLSFHPQSFLSSGHFAGTDAQRASAFVEVANDPDVNAIWFARGGYGSARILRDVLPKLGPVAETKTYLGYSDMGAVLSALLAKGFPDLAHGSMPGDIAREGGEKSVARALKWLVERDPTCVEQTFVGEPAAAFNLITFSQIVGTPWQGALAGRILMLEEVGEYLYRMDRSLLHVTNNSEVQKVRGIAMGRIADVPENDRPFGETAEEIFVRCCENSGIPFLGHADIGHDADNKIVPMGVVPNA